MASKTEKGGKFRNIHCRTWEKERILKIVTGFNGLPFTIQRLCELLTDPRRNYTGTDKFLRGVEKNVMVVSCVCPSSEKNNSNSLYRMNGVMFPGNSPNYTDRSNINGPGTPRPLNRPKLSLSAPLTTNGLPESTDSKDSELQLSEEKGHSDSSASESEVSLLSPVKNKHPDEDAVESEEHEGGSVWNWRVAPPELASHGSKDGSASLLHCPPFSNFRGRQRSP